MKEEIEEKIHEFIEHMYKIGYEDGQKDIIETSKETATIGYEKGLNDAWTAIRKIIPLWEKGYTWYIFDSIDIDWIFKRYSASEAIQKIKEYEQKQNKDEIKVGDEVTLDLSFEDNYIVIGIDNDKEEYYCLNKDNKDNLTRILPKKRLFKTGRHFFDLNEKPKENNEISSEIKIKDYINRQDVINKSWELVYPDGTSERVVSVKDIEEL